MISGLVSKTAIGVALRRAAHQVLDHPVVFRDPLAEAMVAGVGAGQASAGNGRAGRVLRAFVAARSRFAEDELALSFNRGIRSYVLLGAGLDTFAYRNPFAPELEVFEVDHPDTQAWKIARLRAAGIAIPFSLHFVPVNFETQELAQALKDEPAFDMTRLSSSPC